MGIYPLLNAWNGGIFGGVNALKTKYPRHHRATPNVNPLLSKSRVRQAGQEMQNAV